MDSSADGTGGWSHTQASGNGFHTQSRAYRHIVVYGRRRRYLSARYIRVLQDVLLHGQNLRSVKRSIADLNPNYQILSDIARHDTDDIRSKNYAGWDSSGILSYDCYTRISLISHCAANMSGGRVRTVARP